ncbi:head-tail adaptor protein [Streptomyces sp. S.PB5]|uniref:phage head completion protein n=1 Tax=Streptomyces sp. S.PB5 TaxID=3020844 RepID=UPI0025B0F701|nr:head-tail adaptor protein [Streptomyces sp. S.PB5]MDN3021542.1 head-tail adaptor protein [Streptomyces sp. S.PB5]
MIGHWLNRALQVWRSEETDDGHGGQTSTYVRQPDDVRAKVDQPSATDRLLAAQTSSEHSHDIFLLPTADVRRLDELRDETTGEVWKVLHVVGPSTARYRKAQAQLIQGEGEPDG